MDNGRQRANLEFDTAQLALLRQIGEAMGISISSVIKRLLHEALERFSAGEVDFDGTLRPTSRGRSVAGASTETAAIALTQQATSMCRATGRCASAPSGARCAR